MIVRVRIIIILMMIMIIILITIKAMMMRMKSEIYKKGNNINNISMILIRNMLINMDINKNNFQENH